MKDKKLILMIVLIQIFVTIGFIGFYHLTIQGKIYDLREIKVPENCEQIDQVILYPNRDLIAIICEMEVEK